METRNTVQRCLVLEAAGKLPHPTADEVYDAIRAKHPTISRGTVYRNLRMLVAHGQLRRVPLADGADRFDITLRDHYHIRCRICGRVSDVEMPYQADLIHSIEDSHGYQVEDHEILLRGVCPDCQAGARRSRKMSIK